ncbi:recombination regulator RecX [Salisediminibacterium halotolerans]|uniref:Regulatory protein RecX n=1 Tax=Salisediminibacterium halotolerans TaxID=517425 RepID=A0A1H9WQF9_9BACI|nr:recombination regulator RecX [Salisediminibacterium haloalkalitolerans]SES36105.1 regulatory protein [Salisediminibacterium haloalkalitolerans]
MPVISKITAAKKTAGRYHIYLDRSGNDEYSFSVSEDLLVREQLLKGKELTETEVSELKKQDEIDRAYQNAVNYISYRMRSVHEVRSYLADREVPEKEIDSIIVSLSERGFLDDESFAFSYVRTKRDTAKKGPSLIARELKEKGVDAALIERALQEYPYEMQLDDAIRFAEKKQTAYQKESKRKREEKLMQFLMQKGYSTEVAKEAVAEANLENDEETEFAALQAAAEKVWHKQRNKERWEKKQKVKQHLYGKGFPGELIQRWIEEKEETEEN